MEKWLSVWCSKIGSSHIVEGSPCQDSSKVEYLSGTDFVIAAISDGAGSCVNSQIGSTFLVDASIEKLASLIKLGRLFQDNAFELNQRKWKEESFKVFKELKQDLQYIAIEKNLEYKSLSATLIVVISNGSYIACANVGDGRAAFRNRDGEWMAMLNPTKGEEANQTLFITSELWDSDFDSEHFGTFFYSEPITSFALLSDGCERASFEILKYNEIEGKYFDPNIPFKPFFEPNYLNLVKLRVANLDQIAMNQLWSEFLDKGTIKLENETDDKSMILSVFFN